MFGIDPMYYFFMVPGLILAGIAALMTKSTFARYARVGASSGLTGAEAAHRMLQSQGVTDVRIEPVRGFLSDHYDPMSRTLRLSPDVYGSQSLSAIGVACHEAGHALQHAASYAPLMVRTALVPLASFGSNMAVWFIMLGAMLTLPGLMKLGVIVFTAAVAFSLVTLPVEWDASARAKRLMVTAGIVGPSEQVYAGRVLNAAFLTYIAGALTAVMQLLYFMMRAGMLGGRRHD
ncbi:MAG: zinc metallopeptidase [Lentisphaerae bacterium]|nr:zinc metallopeptidase [Lentisphaerota bacterium]